MSEIREAIRAELIRTMVARVITCPHTGEVLDVRTCAVLVDHDGDPAAVYAPVVGQAIRDNARLRDALAAEGYELQEE